MSLKTLGAKVTTKFAKQTLSLQDKSPTILIGLGVVGVATSVVLACRATLKVSEVLAETEENLSKVEGSEEDKKTAVFSTQLQTAITIAKFYAPATVLLGFSVGAIVGSHMILQRRNVAMGAAYAALNTSWKNYRERVVADQGEAKDREYLYGTKSEEIVEEGPNGPEVRDVQVVNVNDIGAGKGSPYARVFEEFNQNWSQVPGRNATFIREIQNWMNDKLRIKGFVFLNEVYELLGFEPTKAGQVVGWVNNGSGDSFIDFGVWNSEVYGGKEWIVRGGKDPIVLDFNVDGVIADLLQEI